MERTIKGVRGDLKQEKQMAFVNALKVLDDEKMEQMYQKALRDIAETVFDMTDEDFENNEVKSVENAKS